MKGGTESPTRRLYIITSPFTFAHSYTAEKDLQSRLLKGTFSPIYNLFHSNPLHRHLWMLPVPCCALKEVVEQLCPLHWLFSFFLIRRPSTSPPGTACRFASDTGGGAAATKKRRRMKCWKLAPASTRKLERRVIIVHCYGILIAAVVMAFVAIVHCWMRGGSRTCWCGWALQKQENGCFTPPQGPSRDIHLSTQQRDPP